MIRDHSIRKIRWGEFLEPFSVNLWTAQLSAMLLVGLCSLIASKVGRHLGCEGDPGPPVHSVGDSLFYTFASFCQQGKSIGYILYNKGDQVLY